MSDQTVFVGRTKRVTPLTDAELNYSPEEWAEALAEDPSCIRAYLEAAEERGRRAWIGDLRAIQQLAEWAVDAVAAEAGRQGGDQLGREAAHAGRINLDRLRERIAALAPRDSASATSDYPGCGDPAHDCRDGVCGAGPAPRDSGKEPRAQPCCRLAPHPGCEGWAP